MWRLAGRGLKIRASNISKGRNEGKLNMTPTSRTDIADIEIRLTKVETKIAELCEKVDYHNKVLIRGNGDKSLIEEVHAVVQFMNDQKDNYKYWSRWIIAGILANIVGYAFAAILWFVKVAPLLDAVLRK